MSFEAPYWLLFVPPLGLAVWLTWRSRDRMARALPGTWGRVISPRLRPAMTARVLGGGHNMLPTYAAILGLIVLALSRPVIGRPDLPEFGNLMGRVLVLDMSGEAEVSGQRLVAERLVQSAPDIPTGIVAFAAEAFDVVPLTTDTAFLLRYLRVLDAGIMPQTGRALHLGILRAEQTLAGVAARQVVVISGGTAPVPRQVPSLSGSGRHILLADGEARDWPAVAKAFGAEITPHQDAGALADDLRAAARRRLGGGAATGLFQLFPACLLVAAAVWLLLFRRRDNG